MKNSVHSLKFTVHKKGFTLIELLIVIALIGILTGIVSVTFQSSQQKARDAQRKSDLNQVKKALEHARNDCLGSSFYPYTSGTDITAFSTLVDVTNLRNANFNYLENQVQDPKNTDLFFYQYSRQTTPTSTSNACPDPSGSLTVSGIKNYILSAKLEITQDPDNASSFTKCLNTIGLVTVTSHTPSTPASGDGYFYVCPD